MPGLTVQCDEELKTHLKTVEIKIVEIKNR